MRTTDDLSFLRSDQDMIGAIIGDIAGSRYERINHKSKEFELFDKKCRPTDDSVMSHARALFR